LEWTLGISAVEESIFCANTVTYVYFCYPDGKETRLMSGLFEELKRRNVVRVGVAYIVVAWLVLQFADLVLENINAPDWVMQSIMLVLAIGLPFAVFFAWAYELTPEGLKTTKEVDRSESVTHNTGRKLDRLIIAVLVVALGYFIWQSQVPRSNPEIPATTAAADDSSESVLPVDAPAEPEELRRSIAVLPFVNMSSDEEQEWFADGLTEEILNSLARTPDLLVTARTSSFAYKGSTEDLPTIAAALGVEHVLEGSVRRAGNRLRVTAQLIRANDGFHLWSQTYDRDVADLIDIQEDVAIAIAQALKTAIDPAALAKFVSSGTDSIPAFEAYLRGIAAMARSFETGDIYVTLTAREAFEEATTFDPEFSLAYWELAGFWRIQSDVSLTHTGATDLSPAEIMEQFEAAQAKATLHESDPVRQMFYRATSAYRHLERQTALRLNREYLKQRPNDSSAQNQQLSLLSDLGYDQELIETIREYVGQDGRGRDVIGNALWMVLYAGDMTVVRTLAQDALQRYGTSVDIIYQSHRALLWSGDLDGASQALPLIEASDFPEDVRILSSLRQACAEKRIVDAERLYRRGISLVDPDDAVTPWIMNKIMGYDELAFAAVQEIDAANDIARLAPFISYRTFDPRPHPNLMTRLGDQYADRGDAVVIPYRCHTG